MKFGEYIIDAQGKDTGREYTGGTDVCVCPECGKEYEHEKGTPCNKMKCSDCDIALTGKDTVGSKV